MLHYNFPPFSVGEVTRPCVDLSRREVGHGYLAASAHSAMCCLLKNLSLIPFALVADILESDGSSLWRLPVVLQWPLCKLVYQLKLWSVVLLWGCS